MATKIILKKSTTGGSAPLAGDLEQAELAINLIDRKIYTKDNSGAVVTLDGAYVDSTAPGNPAEGDLWYDTANNALKAHNGSSFVNVGFTNTSELTNDAGFITGYTVTQSDVTTHEAALTIDWSQLTSVPSLASAPAIVDSSGTPTLAAGITDAEVRTLIGAGTSSFDGAYSSLTGAPSLATVATSGSYNDLTNVPSTFTPSSHDLNFHSDVALSAPSSGDILRYNGTNWINNTLAGAGIAAASDIPTNNNQLTNGAGYITSYTETDTLETVTGRGASSSSAISITNNTASSATSNGALTVTGGVGIGGALNVGGNTIITGDLTVNGTTTTVNSNTVNIGDNIIVLNADETGTPSQDGGITIERGTSANVSFYWDESADTWSLDNQELANVTIDGGTY